MAPATNHAYSTTVEIDECSHLVYRLLSAPHLQHFWAGNQTSNTPDVPLQPGHKWMEARPLLFLRQWCSVEVLAVDPAGLTFTTRLDDNYNCILRRCSVAPHPARPHHSTVTETVECFTKAAELLLPSEKLACMFKKHDQKLMRLCAYLQPCGPVAAEAAPIATISTPMTVMAV